MAGGLYGSLQRPGTTSPIGEVGLGNQTTAGRLINTVSNIAPYAIGAGGLAVLGPLASSMTGAAGTGAAATGAGGGTTALPAGGMTATGTTLGTGTAAYGIPSAGTAAAGGGLTDAAIAAGTGNALSNMANSSSPGMFQSELNAVNNALGTNLNAGDVAALGQGVASLYAGNQTANAARDAAAQVAAASEQARADAAPWVSAGRAALTEQQALMGLGGDSAAALAALQSSPGYTYRLDMGNRAVRAANPTGGGKLGTALSEYNQNFATNEYVNRLNQLAGLSGTGQSQTNINNASLLGGATALGQGNLAATNANMSGLTGAANAFTNWMNPAPKAPSLKYVNGQWTYA